MNLIARWLLVVVATTTSFGVTAGQQKRNAYATMMYMGTPRDYDFYVATRVLMRSLAALNVDADLVVIASLDVPLKWVNALERGDGVRVVRVENLHNPYRNNHRFKQTMNKLYAWSLVDYDRVVMLDADNIFLHKADELFQCGQFCAVFINPCIFHTGLFVLEPSEEIFKDMVHQLDIGRPNSDGFDQGFIGGYFPDLLNVPLFHPPANGTMLNGTFRLPLGYQMDASYYYLQLRWNVPCGPNSVITFPGVVDLKPWYWWSWPVLPLGLSWHEQRRMTLGYEEEMPMVVIQVVFYLGLVMVTRLARPNLSKLCHRRSNRSIEVVLRLLALSSILVAYTVPFFLIPKTLHPILGWSLYLFGSFALNSISIHAFLLPFAAVLTPWLGFLGALLVMAYPWYHDGIQRALVLFGYAFCASPFFWFGIARVLASLRGSFERDAFLTRTKPIS
ncbi:hypothetical protein V2J09_000166 [Rumex salicifolius]